MQKNKTAEERTVSSETIFRDKYLIRRKLFKLWKIFRIYDDSGELAFFSKLKAFRLKEYIPLYTDQSMQNEALRVHATKALNVSSGPLMLSLTKRSGFKREKALSQ